MAKPRKRPMFRVSLRGEDSSLLGKAIEKVGQHRKYHQTRVKELVRDYLVLQALDKSVPTERDLAVAIAEKFEALARSVRTSFEIQSPSQGFPMAMMPTAMMGGAEAIEQEEEPKISEDEHQAILAKMP